MSRYIPELDVDTINLPSGEIDAGTWAITATNVANVASTSTFTGYYMRVGNIVSLQVQGGITPTAGSDTTTTGLINLPVASNFAAATDGMGDGYARTTLPNIRSLRVIGDTSNDKLEFGFSSISTSSHTIGFSAKYEII